MEFMTELGRLIREILQTCSGEGKKKTQKVGSVCNLKELFLEFC